MAKISNPKDVEYLVFQGGGGKGVAYLGALEALEELGILPFNSQNSNSNLKGIAGTSAGAITALLIAMGYTTKEIDENFLSKSDLFTSFFDQPENSSYRTVNSFNSPGRSNRSVNIDLNMTFKDFINNSKEMSIDNPFIRPFVVLLTELLLNSNFLNNLMDAPAHEVIFGLLKGFDSIDSSAATGKLLGAPLKHVGMNSLLTCIINWFINLIMPNLDPEDRHALLDTLLQKPYDYLYNLIFDRGIFPGFSVRKFFHKTIEQRFKDYYSTKINGGEINFEEFYKHTKCNIIFTGVNVTENKVQYFSKDHTPDFPVAEAAAISMNLPFVFKPVYIEIKNLKGFWIDGGTANNLPIHAFDYLEKKELLKRYNEDLYAYLHPKVLALSLVENLPGEKPKQIRSWTDELPILNFLGEVIDTMWDPTEAQIKREVEREQIILIPYRKLETLDFAPSEEDRKGPIEEAYKQVKEYFK